MGLRLQTDVPIAITGEMLQLLRRLSRMSAQNVVAEESPSGVTIRRVHCHVDENSNPKNLPALKRKRTQPKGSSECVECGRRVSANKGICFDCASAIEQARLDREKECADQTQSHAASEHTENVGAA